MKKLPIKDRFSNVLKRALAIDIKKKKKAKDWDKPKTEQIKIVKTIYLK